MGFGIDWGFPHVRFYEGQHQKSTLIATHARWESNYLPLVLQTAKSVYIDKHNSKD